MNAPTYSVPISNRRRQSRADAPPSARPASPSVSILASVPRLVKVVWLLVALAVAIRILVVPGRHTVFPVLAGSSHRYWNDQPLYGNYKPLDYFRYPPVFAVSFTPLAMLGSRLGGILWAWLNLAVYGIGLWRLWRDLVPARDWSEVRQALFFMVALLIGLPGLWNGQSNALAVGLLLIGAAELSRERYWRSAFFLAGAVALKLTPLAPVLLLMAVFPRALLGRLPIALVGIGLVPFLLGPPGMVCRHHEEWLLHLTASSSERWPGFRDAWTLYLAGKHLLGLAPGPLPLEEPLHGHGYRLVQLLTAAAALLWSLLFSTRGELLQAPSASAGTSRRWRSGLVTGRPAATRSRSQINQQLLDTLAIGLVWLMLFGPAVESAGFAFLAPVLAWAVVEPGTSRARRALALLAAGLILVVGCHAVSSLLRPSFPVVVATLPLGTCLVLVWLLTRPRPNTAQGRSLEESRTDLLQNSGLSPLSSRAMRAALRPQAP